MNYRDELAKEMGYTICPLSIYTYVCCDENCENCKEYIEFKQYYEGNKKVRKEAGRVIKQFCDICKVEMGREEILNPINTPKENFKICNQCLDELLEYLENKGNNFKLENKRYERDYRNKWEEIC